MKRIAGVGSSLFAIIVTSAAIMVVAGAVVAHEDEMMHANAMPVAFEQLKSLEGEWEGTSPDGAPFQISYHLTAAGSALMAELKFPDDPGHNMTTVYHPDGDRVMLTHYCAVMNQPRMVSSSWKPGDNRLMFEFKDVTNLEASGGGHMQGLEIEFKDSDTYTEAWTFRSDKGEDAPPMVLTLRRKS